MSRCDECLNSLQLEFQLFCKKMNTDVYPHGYCKDFEPHGTPAEDQHSREPDKVKPLAQYLDEYIQHEWENDNIDSRLYAHSSWHDLLQQALDAYESTEQVKIRIEPV